MLVLATSRLALVLATAAQGPSELELATVHWIEGRVVLPEGTPPGEPVRVEALGREFEDGSHHSVVLGADGSFRVAVPERTRTLRLVLRAPHLYLQRPVRLRVEELPARALLEPALGGRLEARLGFDPDEGSVRLEGQRPADGDDSEGLYSAQAQHAADGVFSFDGLAPELVYRLSWSEAGAPGSVSGLGVVRGSTLAITLAKHDLPHLRGRVVDEHGNPIAGVHAHAGDPEQGVRSDTDGRFSQRMRWSKRTVMTRAQTAVERSSGGWLSAEGFVTTRWSIEASGAELELEACFVLHRGKPLEGRVLLPGGTPAVGFQVEARPHADVDEAHDDEEQSLEGQIVLHRLSLGRAPERAAPQPEVATATTDAEGRFSLGIAVAGELRLSCWGTHDGERWIAERSGIALGSPALEIELTRGAALLGRVVDERGEPVARATVRAVRDAGASAIDVVERSFESEDGTFRLDGLPDGDWSVEIQGATHLAVTSGEARIAASGGRMEVALAPLIALRAAALRGRVLDEQGRPVPSAKLHIYPVNSARLPWEPEHAYAETAADGSFALQRVLPGGAQIVVRATGHGERLVTVELVPGETLELGAVTLPAGARVNGVAFDVRGEPLAGSTVELYGVESVLAPIDAVETDEHGRFELEGLAAGPHEVLARRTGTLSALSIARFVVEDAQTSVEVRPCGPQDVVTVLIHLWTTRGPLSGARVLLTPREAIAPAANREAYEEAPGTYECVVAPGEAWVTVLDELGLFLARMACTFEDPGAGKRKQELAFQLAAGSVRARITADPDLDIDFESVWIEPADWMEPLPFGPGDIYGRRPLFRHLPDGRYRVLAGSSEYSWDEPDPDFVGTLAAEVEVRAASRATARLHLSAARGVRGTVRDSAGNPVPAARVRVWTDERMPLDLVDFATDRLGRFVTWNLPSPIWIAASSGLSASGAPLHVTLDPERPTEIELLLGLATMIDVRVVDEHGRPVRALVRALDEQGFDYRTLNERRVTEALDLDFPLEVDLLESEHSQPALYDAFFLFLGPLPPGGYRLQAKTLDGRRGEQDLEVTGAGERSVEIVVR